MASLTPDSDWMSRVSRRKLDYSAAAGSRDNLTLHRWVLLKNLVVASSPSYPALTSAQLTADEQAAATSPPFEYASPAAEQDVFVFPDADIFEFPDAASLTPQDGVADESAWLEALLDELDSEDEEDADFDVVDEAEVSDPATTAVAFPAASTSAPPVPAPAPAPELALPISLFPASPSSASTSAAPLSPESSHSVLSTCNCITPPPTPSSSLRTPSLFDDLPFGDCDGSDDMSDDESEGPDTPLALSHLQHGSSATMTVEPAVVLPDSDDSYSYFFRPPIARSPLSPHSPEPYPLQEC